MGVSFLAPVSPSRAFLIMGNLNEVVSMVAKGVGDTFTMPQRTQHGNLKARIATLNTQASVIGSCIFHMIINF